MEWLQTVDQTLLLWLQNLRSGWLDGLMIFFTNLGNWGAVWLASGFILLFFRKYRRYGVLLLLCLAVGYLVGDLILKNLIARPRPFAAFPGVELLIPPPHGFSFPSGHTLSACSSAVVLLFAGRRFGVPACFLALMISFSRLYLFVHYPSDVLTGALLGGFFAFGLLRLARKSHWLPEPEKTSRR